MSFNLHRNITRFFSSFFLSLCSLLPCIRSHFPASSLFLAFPSHDWFFFTAICSILCFREKNHSNSRARCCFVPLHPPSSSIQGCCPATKFEYFCRHRQDCFYTESSFVFGFIVVYWFFFFSTSLGQDTPVVLSFPPVIASSFRFALVHLKKNLVFDFTYMHALCIHLSL